jgi:uncharacterized RDD family membrane protein YckC
MYCQFCGSGIPDGDQFCGQCGARAAVVAGAAPPGVQSPSPMAAGSGQQAEPWRQPYTDRDPNAPAMAPRYQYAQFWPRFAAWLLDLIFGLIVASIPSGIIALLLYFAVDASQETPLTFAQEQEQEDARSLAAGLGFFLPWLPLFYGYHYVAMALGGGWGKRICHIRIVKQETGERPGWGSAAIRLLVLVMIGFIGSGFASLLNYLWMIWDKDKQTWHDKAATTVVVRV